MITVTPEAQKQIRIAAEQSGAANLPLRLAAKKNPDGSFDYGMGFDESADDDLSYRFGEIEVIFDAQYGPMLNGATLDYVEIEPGEHTFIVMNPNDPHYVEPGSEAGGCGSGGCGCGH